LAKGQEVNLGCGALIIIAIIVAVCSGAGKTDLGPTERKLDEMDRKLQEIDKKIDEIAKRTKKE
jgi:predicted transcriptional regulator